MTTTEITAAEIKSKICSFFSVTSVSDLLSKRKNTKEDVVFRREVLLYCLWTFTDLNPKQISVEIFRERSAVFTLIRQVRQKITVSAEYKKKIMEIEELFE